MCSGEASVSSWVTRTTWSVVVTGVDCSAVTTLRQDVVSVTFAI